ncbi:uncharacterized protein FN964_004874 isoform 3-T4 [Alca torda]
MTVARGNPAAHQVLVDSWPHFGVVLTRLRPEEHKDPQDFYTNQLTVYYRDEGAWRELLGGTQAVDWTRAFQMQGYPRACAWPPCPRPTSRCSTPPGASGATPAAPGSCWGWWGPCPAPACWTPAPAPSPGPCWTPWAASATATRCPLGAAEGCAG